MAEKSPYRIGWDLNTDEGTATATLKQKNEESGEMEVLDSETFDVATIEQAGLGSQVALYGLSKVLQDRASSESGPDKLEAMKSEYDQLAQGQWKSTGGGQGSGGISPVVEAIANLKGISLNAAAKSYKALSKQQKEAVKANPQVAEEIERVKAERQSSGEADLTDLAG